MQRKYSSSVRIFYPRFDRETIIKILQKKIQALKKELPVSLIVLFGSYAKDNYTAKSDIDLLVVYRGKVKDAYTKVKKIIDIYGTQPHVYSEEEYAAIKPTVDKMIEKGIVIFKQP
ncbi:MAG TPA: nucleotidyltransferase domain-containing protein [Candidatus Aerophobetes bacterium]|uniref:Nucleotidyltransferase domain-containing protein n=1 Tax=Aerophobetes bacterium TaxID=2030807 RepID=A0A7V5I0A9_UNCAE|nr:nucleotidyltransferase domain-containing protein [Candidatus Aerophobetes bacterium]